MSGLTPRSIRGMVVNYHLIKKNESLSWLAGESGPVFDYIQEQRIDGQSLHLLEISVFDSGCGILKSYARGNLSEINEFDIIAKSFLKGVTSKKNGLGYGRGLNNARQILNERKGFLRLRSGLSALYRNYLSDPLEDFNTDVNFSNEFEEKLSLCPSLSEGLSYSILVPVK